MHSLPLRPPNSTSSTVGRYSYFYVQNEVWTWAFINNCSAGQWVEKTSMDTEDLSELVIAVWVLVRMAEGTLATHGFHVAAPFILIKTLSDR